jgi:secreted PhoX family phosphatase
MISRRRFLQSVAAAAVTPALTISCISKRSAEALLLPDPDRIISLPEGFSYSMVSRKDEPMSDGLRVPGAHDGMAAFEGSNGRVILVCNHELDPSWPDWGAFGDRYPGLPETTRQKLYDRGGDKTPGLGGTTTSIYNPATRETERQFLSLGGTETNCGGGKTPWGSWLSCEECYKDPGKAKSSDDREYVRDMHHGYVFEVPSLATELVGAVPLKAMGRFEHEAAAVHEPTGIVYLTEDSWHSLFYRFIPDVPGQLRQGGRLQALAITGKPSQKTHNWDAANVRVNETLTTHWIDLQDVDSLVNDLSKRGAEAGAATFARGEGITAAGDQFAFTCTIGGEQRLGQVFTYKPSPHEGTPVEQNAPGGLTLIAEGHAGSLLKNGDNLTMAPWGDLLLCEDTDRGSCAVVGIRPDGSQYLLANNTYSDSELAGVCFSPDGQTMFVNIQYPGMTVAITGSWPASSTVDQALLKGHRTYQSSTRQTRP